MSKLQVDQVSKTSAGAATFVLPADDGTVGQYMKTDGSGQLGWVSAASATLAPAFSAYTSAATTSITTATDTKIVLDTEEFDSSSAFDSTTNYRFTVPAGGGGKYLFSAGVTVLGGNPTTMQANVRKNNVARGQSEESFNTGGGSSAWNQNGVWMFDLVATDYIELWAYVVSTGTLTYAGHATSQKTWLSGFKLVGI